MASVYLEGGTGQFGWAITGLDNPFNTTYYERVGVATSPATYDSLSSPSGMLDYLWAFSTGTARRVPDYGTIAGSMAPGTYTIYGFAQAANLRYYPAGSGQVTVGAVVQRPSNWSWSNAFVSGQSLNITATDWNSFCVRINEFRRYKGLSVYSFTSVVRGGIMYASHVNQAINAINSLTGLYASEVYVGSSITPTLFHDLRDRLNDVI